MAGVKLKPSTNSVTGANKSADIMVMTENKLMLSSELCGTVV